MAYAKYYIYKEKVSYDSGHTWSYTGAEVASGDPIQIYDTLAECEYSGYSGQYLTFVALDSGAISFKKQRNSGSFQYKKNDGRWITNNSAVTVDSGDVVMWKGEMTPYTSWPYGIGQFDSTCHFIAEGNVMSLLYGDNFVGQTDLSEKAYAFWCLFESCFGITSIDNLVLPATTLANNCYALMFDYCKLLTSIPSGLLHATTLASNCYECMFRGCTSLTSIPSGLLPATTLAEGCYGAMFDDCINLTSIPRGLLHATTLAEGCYSAMFFGCESITTAPDLPATTLADGCYREMFMWCTALTTAPQLYATTLVNNCYSQMFDGCSSLTAITCLATDISATDCTMYWIRRVAESGTFTKAASMNDWTTTYYDGIPSGWTVVNYS